MADSLVLGVVVLVFFVLGFAVLIILAGRIKSPTVVDRSERLNNVARSMGFVAQLNGRLTEEIKGTHLKLVKAGGSVHNLVYGTREGLDVAVFKCIIDDNRESTSTYTLVLFSLPAADLPYFHLRPNPFPVLYNFIRKILGLREKNYSKNLSFYDQYRLTGKEHELSGIFSKRVMDYFSKKPGWTLEGHRQIILMHKSDESTVIEDYPALLKEALDILWFLKRDLGSDFEKQSV